MITGYAKNVKILRQMNGQFLPQLKEGVSLTVV